MRAGQLGQPVCQFRPIVSEGLCMKLVGYRQEEGLFFEGKYNGVFQKRSQLLLTRHDIDNERFPRRLQLFEPVIGE